MRRLRLPRDELLGVTAGEAENPQQTLRKATNTLPVRIAIFYVGALVVLAAALSSCNSGIHSTGRMLRGLAVNGEAPVVVKRLSGRRLPAADFAGQPGVVNGASELLRQVRGDKGVHARSAVGVAVLPLNAPVEVEVQVEISD
ncbi:hypothetical protein ACIPSJ_22470 [Streptomyces sp. NPDC090088]|uniref:RidA family protein n=1 Tax=Streptomyces sp. NPDC090088 TaxID=3365944 RepID=UPI0037FAE6C0